MNGGDDCTESSLHSYTGRQRVLRCSNSIKLCLSLHLSLPIPVTSLLCKVGRGESSAPASERTLGSSTRASAEHCFLAVNKTTQCISDDMSDSPLQPMHALASQVRLALSATVSRNTELARHAPACDAVLHRIKSPDTYVGLIIGIVSLALCLLSGDLGYAMVTLFAWLAACGNCVLAVQHASALLHETPNRAIVGLLALEDTLAAHAGPLPPAASAKLERMAHPITPSGGHIPASVASALVYRDAQWTHMPVHLLVKGDIVALSTGASAPGAVRCVDDPFCPPGTPPGAGGATPLTLRAGQPVPNLWTEAVKALKPPRAARLSSARAPGAEGSPSTPPQGRGSPPAHPSPSQRPAQRAHSAGHSSLPGAPPLMRSAGQQARDVLTVAADTRRWVLLETPILSLLQRQMVTPCRVEPLHVQQSRAFLYWLQALHGVVVVTMFLLGVVRASLAAASSAPNQRGGVGSQGWLLDVAAPVVAVACLAPLLWAPGLLWLSDVLLTAHMCAVLEIATVRKAQAAWSTRLLAGASSAGEEGGRQAVDETHDAVSGSSSNARLATYLRAQMRTGTQPSHVQSGATARGVDWDRLQEHFLQLDSRGCSCRQAPGGGDRAPLASGGRRGEGGFAEVLSHSTMSTFITPASGVAGDSAGEEDSPTDHDEHQKHDVSAVPARVLQLADTPYVQYLSEQPGVGGLDGAGDPVPVAYWAAGAPRFLAEGGIPFKQGLSRRPPPSAGGGTGASFDTLRRHDRVLDGGPLHRSAASILGCALCCRPPRLPVHAPRSARHTASDRKWTAGKGKLAPVVSLLCGPCVMCAKGGEGGSSYPPQGSGAPGEGGCCTAWVGCSNRRWKLCAVRGTSLCDRCLMATCGFRRSHGRFWDPLKEGNPPKAWVIPAWSMLWRYVQAVLLQRCSAPVTHVPSLASVRAAGGAGGGCCCGSRGVAAAAARELQRQSTDVGMGVRPLVPPPISSGAVLTLGGATSLIASDRPAITEEAPTAEQILFLRGTQEQVILDLHRDREAPHGIRFEDPRWRQHLPALKPIGLAAMAASRLAGAPPIGDDSVSSHAEATGSNVEGGAADGWGGLPRRPSAAVRVSSFKPVEGGFTQPSTPAPRTVAAILANSAPMSRSPPPQNMTPVKGGGSEPSQAPVTLQRGTVHPPTEAGSMMAVPLAPPPRQGSGGSTTSVERGSRRPSAAGDTLEDILNAEDARSDYGSDGEGGAGGGTSSPTGSPAARPLDPPSSDTADTPPTLEPPPSSPQAEQEASLLALCRSVQQVTVRGWLGSVALEMGFTPHDAQLFRHVRHLYTITATQGLGHAKGVSLHRLPLPRRHAKRKGRGHGAGTPPTTSVLVPLPESVVLQPGGGRTRNAGGTEPSPLPDVMTSVASSALAAGVPAPAAAAAAASVTQQAPRGPLDGPAAAAAHNQPSHATSIRVPLLPSSASLVPAARVSAGLKPALVSSVLQDVRDGSHHLTTVGSVDAVLSACSEYWDGQSIFNLSPERRQAVLDTWRHWASEDMYCVAVAYDPMSRQQAQVVGAITAPPKRRKNAAAGSLDLCRGGQTPPPAHPLDVGVVSSQRATFLLAVPKRTKRNARKASQGKSNSAASNARGGGSTPPLRLPPHHSDSPRAPAATAADAAPKYSGMPTAVAATAARKGQLRTVPRLIAGTGSARKLEHRLHQLQRGQVLAGIVAARYQPRDGMQTLIGSLGFAGVRFAYMSTRNYFKVRPLAQKLGLETGWNCAICLKDRPLGSRAPKEETLTEIVRRVPHVVDAGGSSDVEHAVEGPAEGLLVSEEAGHVGATAGPDLSAFFAEDGDDDDALKHDVDEGAQTSSDEEGGARGLRRRAGGLHVSDSSDDEGGRGGKGGGGLSALPPSGLRVLTDAQAAAAREGATAHAHDWDSKAQLPHGLREINEHILTLDNVPLLVSLFTEATPLTTAGMLRVMQRNGECAVLAASALRRAAPMLLECADVGIAYAPPLMAHGGGHAGGDDLQSALDGAFVGADSTVAGLAQDPPFTPADLRNPVVEFAVALTTLHAAFVLPSISAQHLLVKPILTEARRARNAWRQAMVWCVLCLGGAATTVTLLHVAGIASLLPPWLVPPLALALALPLGGVLLLTPLEPGGMTRHRTPEKRDHPIWERDGTFHGAMTPAQLAAAAAKHRRPEALQPQPAADAVHKQAVLPSTAVYLTTRNDSLAILGSHPQQYPWAVPAQEATAPPGGTHGGAPLADTDARSALGRNALWLAPAAHERLGRPIPLVHRRMIPTGRPPLFPAWRQGLCLLAAMVLPAALWVAIAAAATLDATNDIVFTGTDDADTLSVYSHRPTARASLQSLLQAAGQAAELAQAASAQGTVAQQPLLATLVQTGRDSAASTALAGGLLGDAAALSPAQCALAGSVVVAHTAATCIAAYSLLAWMLLTSGHWMHRSHSVLQLLPTTNRVWLPTCVWLLLWSAVALEGIWRAVLAAHDASCASAAGEFQVQVESTGTDLGVFLLSMQGVLGTAAARQPALWVLAVPSLVWAGVLLVPCVVGCCVAAAVKEVDATAFEGEMRGRRAFFDTRLGMYSPR